MGAPDRKNVPRRLGFLFVVIVLLAACGSAEVEADKHADTKAAALEPKKNRNTFRAEAKTACAGLHRRLVRLEKGKASPNRVLVEVADAWDASLRKLRRLDPPPRDRRRFRQMLVYFGRAVRAIRAVPTAEGEMVLAPIAAMLDQGGKGATIAQSLGLLTCSAAPPAPTKQELARWRKHVERAARKQFAQLPRLDQPAHPGRVRPRVEAAPGS